MSATSSTSQPYPIRCSTCGAEPGVRCEGQHANHISRGIDLAIERSPYEPVFVRAGRRPSI